MRVQVSLPVPFIETEKPVFTTGFFVSGIYRSISAILSGCKLDAVREWYSGLDKLAFFIGDGPDLGSGTERCVTQSKFLFLSPETRGPSSRTTS